MYGENNRRSGWTYNYVQKQYKSDFCILGPLQGRICILLQNIYTNIYIYFYYKILQSSVSHDPSEIILICLFAAQETFTIIFIIYYYYYQYLTVE